MADSPSTKPAPASKRPVLLPQAEHAGKPSMPLGAHLFTLIGARNRAHLHLLSSTISRNHAGIVTGKSGVYIRDLASRNGVIVNGRKVRESELQDGDLVQLGSFKFKFQEPPGPIRIATAPRPPLAMLDMDRRALTPMDERTILIGRRAGCDITLDSPAVSNTHAVIFECDGKRYVRDLGSRTGTQVNGTTVHQQALEIGDQIKVGNTTLRYVAAEMPAVESADVADAIPLEFESAAAHEVAAAPTDLDFDQPASVAEELEPAAQSAQDPIPLIEPTAQYDEASSDAMAADAASEIDFAASHPVDQQISPPVEEEIPLVQQDFTAAAPVIAEPTEELPLDTWTPEPEHAVAADISAINEPQFTREEPVDAGHAPHAIEAPSEEDATAHAEPSTFQQVDTPAHHEEPGIATESSGVSASESSDPSDDITPQAAYEQSVEIDHVPAEITAGQIGQTVLTDYDQPAEFVISGITESHEAEVSAEPELETLSAPEVEADVDRSTEHEVDLTRLAWDAPADVEGAVTAQSSEQISLDTETAALGEAIETQVDEQPPSAAQSEQIESIFSGQTDQPAPEAAISAPQGSSDTIETTLSDATAEGRTEEARFTSGAGIESPAIVDTTEPVSESPPANMDNVGPAALAEEEITSLQAAEVDFPSVTFDDGAARTAVTDENISKTPTPPVPVLDLIAPATEEAIKPVETPADEKRSPRSPRRKARARRKKNGFVADAAPATAEGDLTTSPPDHESCEVSAIDVSPVLDTPGFDTPGFDYSAAVSNLDSAPAVTAEPLPTVEPGEPTPVDVVPRDEPTIAESHATGVEPPFEAMLSESQPRSEPEHSGGLSELAADQSAPISEVSPFAEDVVPATGVTGTIETPPVSVATTKSQEVLPDLEQVEGAQNAPEPIPAAAIEAALQQSTSAAAEPSPAPDELQPEVDLETAAPPALKSEDLHGSEAPPEVAVASEVTSHTDFVAPIEDAPINLTQHAVETIAETEPTPESALDLEPSLPDVEPVPVETLNDPDALLSDSAFGQVVTDFAGMESGPLVEEAKVTAPSTAPELDTPREAVAGSSQTLPPLVDDDLPPLELGEALTFGADDEAPAAEEHAGADELSLEQPVETDSTPATVTDLEFTIPEASEPALDLEEPPELDAELTSSVVEAPSFDSGLEWEEPFAITPAADESGLEFDEQRSSSDSIESRSHVDSTPIGGDSREASQIPSIESEGASAPSPIEKPDHPGETSQPRARPPINPFFGMERDLGSFIGGMPLALAPTPPQNQTQTLEPAAPRVPHADLNAGSTTPAGSKVEQPLALGDTPEEDVDLDKLFEGEEPLELFDETADQLDALPDSLEPISDVGSAIGEPLSMPPAAPPALAARTPSLRSLTADPAAAAPKPPTTSVSVPPFAGAAGRAGLPGGNPFAGLSGLRPTDVFSQTAFPPMDEPVFKATPVKSQPIDAPPLDRTKSSDAGFVRRPGSDSGGPPPKTDADAIGAAPPPYRSVAPRPTAAMLADRPSDKRPWWKNIRVLLPLLLVLIAAAVLAIIRFFPPKTIVQGTLQINGIDQRDVGVYARREQIDHIRQALKQSSLQDAVRQRIKSEGVSAGFLQDAGAFDAMSDPSNSPFEENRLVLQRPQTDPQDPQRMRAVLDAIYLDSKTAAEQTGQARQQAAVASENLKAMSDRIKAQQERLNKIADQVKTAGGTAAADLLANPIAAVQALEQQNADLHKAVEQANVDVKQTHDDWEHAQEGAHEGGADPKVAQIRQSLSSLNNRLTVARLSGGAQADPAKVFDNAVGDIERDLTLFAAASAKKGALTTYLATARRATGDIRAMINGQQQDAARIDEIRQQLAAHHEAHLRQVWAADETLRNFLEDRDAQAHRFSAASDSGYAQDAARIRGALDELDQKIEARRQSLATDAGASDQLQQKLEQALDQQQDDRRDKEGRITAALARLDVPLSTKLQPSEEQMVDRLGQDVAAAKAAHEQYAGGANQPLASNSEAQTQKLQSQIAEQQAQLDAYEQRNDAKAAVDAARRALDAAQDTQAKAQDAWAANLSQLTIARKYRDEQLRLSDSMAVRDAANLDAQAKATEAVSTPILLPPDPQNAVQSVSLADQRIWYLAGAIGLIVLLFAGPLWMAVREHQQDLPYAARATHHPSVVEDDERVATMDDEHPALT